MNEKLYIPPAVTVDVVIFTIRDNGLKVLLIKRANKPFKGVLALPGGFLSRNETARSAALRVLKEKAGIQNVYLEQLYTFDDPKRDPRGHVVTVAYFALVPSDAMKIQERISTQNPELYSIKKLPKLAFDHRKIVQYALKRTRAKCEYTNATYSLLPRFFTLSQLQKTYEIIFSHSFDKRNFRKKFLALGLIQPTRKSERGNRQRPARLYEFISRKPEELKKFF